MSHTDYAKDTDEEPNSALQMFFKRTRIGRIARIALWALLLEVFKTTNTIGTTDTTVGRNLRLKRTLIMRICTNESGGLCCWRMSHTDHADGHGWSLTRLCCLRF